MEDALEAIEENNIEFPILVIPVPEMSSSISIVVHDLDKIPIVVSFLLGESYYCVKPTVHLISKKGCGSWWDKQDSLNNYNI